MLEKGLSYEELRETFKWNVPSSYNMGWDVCDKWADIEPDRVAIIDLVSGVRRNASYGELKSRSNQLANRLHEMGIKQGDRIGVLRSQSVWTAAAHIAIWKLGAISMPLFKLFGEDALMSRLSNSGTKLVVCDEEGAQKLTPLQPQLPDLENLLVPEQENLDAMSGQFEIAATGPETPGLLIYTSGTTGPPKGALHGHRVLHGHLPGIEMSHGLLPCENDVLWTPADWAWIGGLMNVLMPGLHNGVPVVAAKFDRFNGEEARRIICDGKVRNIFFPPTALRMLKAEGTRLEGLRTVACGGEPLGEEMLAWGKQALGLTINEFFGQTECNMVLSSCADLFSPKPGAIGRPVPGHEVAVIDDKGNLTLKEGDISIRRGSASMMLEYWNNPQATKEKFRTDSQGEEWLLTGDRGIYEGEFIRFVGRDDDVITSAGYRIGPAEIEDCLLKHEAVASVGVVGKPDEERTEIVKAYVLLREEFGGSEAVRSSLQEHVKNTLSPHEYPREITFVDALPMTVTGKIIRKELRARAIAEIT